MHVNIIRYAERLFSKENMEMVLNSVEDSRSVVFDTVTFLVKEGMNALFIPDEQGEGGSSKPNPNPYPYASSDRMCDGMPCPWADDPARRLRALLDARIGAQEHAKEALIGTLEAWVRQDVISFTLSLPLAL